jgi:hypothetical protein
MRKILFSPCHQAALVRAARSFSITLASGFIVISPTLIDFIQTGNFTTEESWRFVRICSIATIGGILRYSVSIVSDYKALNARRYRTNQMREERRNDSTDERRMNE